MIRRTKIVATLGPACSDAKTLDRMMEAGLDVVRLNFSHGVAQDHIDRAELVRSLARTRGRAVGVLVDLTRKSGSRSHCITLARSDPILDAACPLEGRPVSVSN
jgi:pyruvate kinase